MANTERGNPPSDLQCMERESSTRPGGAKLSFAPYEKARFVYLS